MTQRYSATAIDLMGQVLQQLPCDVTDGDTGCCLMTIGGLAFDKQHLNRFEDVYTLWKSLDEPLEIPVDGQSCPWESLEFLFKNTFGKKDCIDIARFRFKRIRKGDEWLYSIMANPVYATTLESLKELYTLGKSEANRSPKERIPLATSSKRQNGSAG